MDDGVWSRAAVAERAAAHEVRAKLFMHGGSQAVRLPKAFRFEGAEVSVHRDGDAVVLRPLTRKPPRTREEMAAFWRRLDDLRGDMQMAYPDRDRSLGREPPEW